MELFKGEVIWQTYQNILQNIKAYRSEGFIVNRGKSKIGQLVK